MGVWRPEGNFPAMSNSFMFVGAPGEGRGQQRLWQGNGLEGRPALAVANGAQAAYLVPGSPVGLLTGYISLREWFIAICRLSSNFRRLNPEPTSIHPLFILFRKNAISVVWMGRLPKIPFIYGRRFQRAFAPRSGLSMRTDDGIVLDAVQWTFDKEVQSRICHLVPIQLCWLESGYFFL